MMKRATPSSRSPSRITVTLAENDLGQLLDGLEVLIDDWDRTYRYHAYGEVDAEHLIRECGSAEEAQGIRDHYQRIADELYRQLEAGRKGR